MSTSSRRRPRLGVNVDHVATLRQQRDTLYPDPVIAAGIAELAGADQITVHLREDRRHIQERDVRILRETVQTAFNLEMAATDEMVDLARSIRPDTVTLVPEKREERTTEGGLDVVTEETSLVGVIDRLKEANIAVSLFVDPDTRQIDACRRANADIVELHTGDYCRASETSRRVHHLDRLMRATEQAGQTGLAVGAGHGLDYRNVGPIAAIPLIEELNIGHSIICRAVMVGMERAVLEMLDVIEGAVA